MVEEGGEEAVAGWTPQQFDPVPELLCLLSPQELELLLFVQFVDDQEVLVLETAEVESLIDGLPGLLQERNELILYFADAVDEIPLF